MTIEADRQQAINEMMHECRRLAINVNSNTEFFTSVARIFTYLLKQVQPPVFIISKAKDDLKADSVIVHEVDRPL